MSFFAAIRGLACLFLCWSGLALALEAIPPLAARVTDRSGTLSSQQIASLEETLKDFEARKGSQIAILMVPTTGEESIEQYALRAAEQWKLGRRGVDDGALLVVAKNDRALRIEVGYGLEGVLTDAASKRIISETIVPRFRQGDFYGGLAAGVGRIIQVAEGEPLPPPGPKPAAGPGQGIGQYGPVIFLLALVFGSVLRALLGRFLGAAVTGGIAGFLAWSLLGTLAVALLAGAIAFFFTLLGGLGGRVGRYGGWGGGWGGGTGSGGLGNGGFRGGGGGFGGGGASGRW